MGIFDFLKKKESVEAAGQPGLENAPENPTAVPVYKDEEADSEETEAEDAPEEPPAPPGLTEDVQ
jgi:hypothetical protein